MKTLLLLTLVALSSCSTTSHTAFNKGMDTWVGGSEEKLITLWGPPSSTYPMPDGASRILTWNRIGETTTQQYGSVSKSSTHACKVDVTVNAAHTIQSWRAEGSDCVAVSERESWRIEDAKKQQEMRRSEYGQDVD
jgi:hypothetical protein